MSGAGLRYSAHQAGAACVGSGWASLLVCPCQPGWGMSIHTVRASMK